MRYRTRYIPISVNLHLILYSTEDLKSISGSMDTRTPALAGCSGTVRIHTVNSYRRRGVTAGIY